MTKQDVSIRGTTTRISPISEEDPTFDPRKLSAVHMLIGKKGIALFLVIYKGEIKQVMLVPHVYIQENGCCEPEPPAEPEDDDMDEAN